MSDKEYWDFVLDNSEHRLFEVSIALVVLGITIGFIMGFIMGRLL